VTTNRHDKTEQGSQPALPVVAAGQIKAPQRDAGPQHQAGEEPQRYTPGIHRPLHRPPQATKEHGAEYHADQQRK